MTKDCQVPGEATQKRKPLGWGGKDLARWAEGAGKGAAGGKAEAGRGRTQGAGPGCVSERPRVSGYVSLFCSETCVKDAFTLFLQKQKSLPR